MYGINSFKVILGIVLFVALFLPKVAFAEEQLSSTQWFDKGVTYQQNKNYNEAIWAYGEAIKLNPQFMLAYNNRGDMYLYTNRMPLASDDYSKAIELGSQIPNSYLFRGAYYNKKGLYDLAIADVNKAIDLNPQYGLAYYFRALIYSQMGAVDLAITDIDKSAESIPWDLPPILTTSGMSIPALHEGQLFAVYFTKANICEQAGRKREAISSYKLAGEYIKYNASVLNKTELDVMKKFLNDKIKNLGG